MDELMQFHERLKLAELLTTEDADALLIAHSDISSVS